MQMPKALVTDKIIYFLCILCYFLSPFFFPCIRIFPYEINEQGRLQIQIVILDVIEVSTCGMSLYA